MLETEALKNAFRHISPLREARAALVDMVSEEALKQEEAPQETSCVA